MLEVKVTIDAPALVATLEKVAEAVAMAHTTQVLMQDNPSGALKAAVEPPQPVPTRAPEKQPQPGSTGAMSAAAQQLSQAMAQMPPAGTTPGSVPTTAAPAPGPGPSPTPATTASTTGQTQTAPGSAPAAPTTAPSYTVEQLQKAGGDLITADPGKMPALLALLQQFGVAAVTGLKPEQYGPFATALRGIGAVI